ncbi:MAG: lamin tail domain-containing protein, partial [Verrucomicrobia bacterium]|nr:lamin tail domain-containing protein [Verrucomicrobiota bacterium]
VSAEALTYQQPIQIEQGVLLKARTLVSTTNWSALSEATFQVAELGLPLRITELNYNPQGGDAYEFIELQNVSSTPLDLSGFALQGVDFRFSEGTSLAGGARLVLISPLNPALFAQRYPSVAVGGIFDGNLSNGGESLALVDRTGRKVVSLTYDDEGGWPIDADNGGRSLEIIDPDGDPNDPANWRASVQLGGSPGAANPAVALANVRLNEIFAGRSSIPGDGSPWPDFIELYNAGATTANVGNWSVSTDDDSKRFVLPAGTSIAPGGYLVIWCDGPSGAAGLHASFNLELHGGSVFLSDALANRVDALTYGLQLPSFSVGRIGGESLWQLTEPTPDGLNEIANVGAPAELAINEFLANAPPGQDDWIELHNMNVALPVSLQGLYVGTSNALQQLRSLSFVAPGGFARLFADEDVGPDHLDFKLPATGGAIVLADPVGAELSRVTYAAQKEGVTQGRLPDGTGSVVSFVNSASPGAPNYQISYTGPILNELMARNVAGVTDSAGRVADWVELYNPTAAEFDLSGMSLSVNESKPGQWVFPAGTTIAANDYLVLWCDGSRPASANLEATLNVGNSLAGDSGGVYLFTQAGQLADFVEYGFQIEDAALGRSGGSWSLLASATPDAANATPANLGALNNLRINEWMATSDGQDWLELFNADALPVSLAGVYLTDDPSISGLTNTAVAPLSFIAGAGWVKFAADGDLSKGRDHLRFSLDALGETVRVYGPTLGLIDSVDIGVQQAGVAQGRWPDGTATIVSFPTTPTPGAANYLPHPAIVISEVLTHTDPPFVEDAIEVFNRSEEAVDLSGWFLSNSQRDFKKYRVPAGTVIPARAFKVFYEADFNPLPGTPGSFTLNSAHGDEVHLSEADATGALTGYRASVEFGAAERDVSFGRYVTVLGEDFAPLERRTFGADELVSLEHFRTGTGLFNAYPKVGPVVINELMYHPATLVETNLVENEEEEFIELHNITDRPVELFDFTHRTNTWRLDKGVEFTFPQGETLAARGFLLVVNFDPLTNVTALAAFRKRYGVTAGVRLLGPYGGKLNNDGDRVELLRPDEPQAPPHPDAGFVPYLLVDCVNYTDQLPWPLEADEGSASLQRRIAEAYGNNAANWSARPPTPGRVNATPATTDADIDGQLDVWEILNGLNPNDAYDASVDLDHDGLTSAQEFVSGTDPLNPASYLHFEPPTVAGAKAVLRFTAAANKSYTVLFRDALDAGDWQRLGDVEAQAAPRMAEVPDTKPNLTGHRFYQLRTPRLP